MKASRRRYCFFLAALILVLTSYASAGLCPPADLDADCWVNLSDLNIFVEQWLEYGECEGEQSCANFDGLNGIDFLDFSFLADFWRDFGPSLVINELMASNNGDSGISEAQMARIRLSTHTGRPLGTDSFMSKLEKMLGRRVRPLPIGRPRKKTTKS